MDLFTLRYILLILAAGAALLQERRARGLAASATAAAAAGVIALGVSLGTGATRPLPVALGLAGLPPSFLAGTAGLFLVAGLLAGTRLLPADAPGLAALCVGGLLLYAAAGWAFGAITRADLAILAKKS